MKKGFTLIELVASLIILSVVALIVVNNVLTHIRKYKDGLYEMELNTIESSAKNWIGEYITDTSNLTLADLQIVVEDQTEYIYLPLKTLKTDGFVSEDIYNPKNSENFTDYVFVVIKRSKIPKNDYNNETYKYTYEVIDTTDKLLNFIVKKIQFTQTESTVYPIVYSLSSIFNMMPDLLKLEGVTNKFIDIEKASLISQITITINSKTDYTISI